MVPLKYTREKQRGLTLIVSATVACLVAIIVLLGFYTTYGNYVKNVRALHLKEVAKDIASSKLATMKANSVQWYQARTEENPETRERYEFRVLAESRDTPKPDKQELMVTVRWSEQSRERSVFLSEPWSCERPPTP